MDVNTIKEILVLVAPVVANVVVTIIAVVNFIRFSKAREVKMQEEILNNTRKMKKSFDDIAIIKTKLASIEKYLSEKGKK